MGFRWILNRKVRKEDAETFLEHYYPLRILCACRPVGRFSAGSAVKKRLPGCNIGTIICVIRPKSKAKHMNDNLKDLLTPLFILGTLGASVYFFTKVITDYILKKKMIEKGFVNDDTQAIFKQHNLDADKFPSLKWGLIAFFAGLSLIIMEYVPVTPESPLPYGLFTIAVSLGFLIYFFIVKKDAK